MPQQDEVQPSDASASTRCGAELLTVLPDPVAGFIQKFRGKRARAHARRVGLANAKHRVDRARSNSRAQTSSRRGRIAARDVGIRTGIQIEKRPLRTLEKNLLAA